MIIFLASSSALGWAKLLVHATGVLDFEVSKGDVA